MIETTPPLNANDSFESPDMRSGELRDPLRIRSELTVGTFQSSNGHGFASSDGSLAIVTDASGDERIGDTICSQTIEVIQQFLTERSPLAQTAAQLRSLIRDALTAANSAIVRTIRETDGRRAGCSLVLAQCVNSMMFVKSVGDCRAYLLRNDVLKQLTRDHTLSQLLAVSGQAQTRLQGSLREVLLNCLGVHDFEPNDEFASFDFRTGDRVLLANGGLPSRLSKGEIQSILSHANSAAEAATTLGHAGIERGAKNVACVTMFEP